MRPAALERLRAAIRAAAPDATEVISYRVPTFKHHGGLVGFAGFESHCSFFVMSPEVMEAHAEELEPYDTAKATIRFAPDQPLPDALVEACRGANQGERGAFYSATNLSSRRLNRTGRSAIGTWPQRSKITSSESARWRW